MNDKDKQAMRIAFEKSTEGVSQHQKDFELNVYCAGFESGIEYARSGDPIYIVGDGWQCHSEPPEGTELFTHSQVAPEIVSWPCTIDEADFENNTITLKMQSTDYTIGAGLHWLSKGSKPAPLSAQIPGWVQVVDEEMVGAHLGIADVNDSYETAKKKLNDLICCHINFAKTEAAQGNEKTDPFQDAADWIFQATTACTVGDIQNRLLIGFNRANRLYQAAAAAEAQKVKS